MNKYPGLLKWAILALGALFLAVGLKTWLVVGGWISFNSDEAVVALMARHILGGERPIFFYGQAYMGSLDAFLVAGAFRLFGEKVWAIRLVQSILYLGILATTTWLGKLAFRSWKAGALAMLLLAIPTVNVSLYTTASLGGYGEALLLGNVILICGLYIARIMRQQKSIGPLWLWGFLGLASGIGLWAFGLTLVYSLPVYAYLAFCLPSLLPRKPESSHVEGEGSPNKLDHNVVEGGKVRWRLTSAVGALLLGWMIGSAPWWSYALENGFQKLLGELSGGAIAGVEQLPWILQVWGHVMSLGLLGSTVTLGMRPPWDVTWLALPLAPFVMLFWMAVVVYIFRSMRRGNPERGAQGVLVGVMLTLILGFIFTPFGADPSGRYFLPLAVPMALFAGSMVMNLRERIGVWVYGLIALILVFHLWGTVQSALRYPPGITTQFYAPAHVDHRFDEELIAFLYQNDELRGYGNYWVTYPLAFHSGEELIFTPRLPYHLDFRHTERDDRYAPYGELVEKSGRVAYITTNHPDLNDYLRVSFTDLGVAWQEVQIGDYTVFYTLSRPVRPEEINLGENSPAVRLDESQ